jgi:hypothetical protein
MFDNKYLYFNNLVYSYVTIGYKGVSTFDKEILLITILDIFTKEFSQNLGWITNKYMLDYKQDYSSNILYKNKVPTLKNLAIHTIQRCNLDHKPLCHHLQLQVKVPLWSVFDTHTHVVSFFRFLFNSNKKKLLDYLVGVHNSPS